MRIIGGTYRHRRLAGPRDEKTTRPITDRVKQAMFDRLTVMQAFDGAAVDLFAGVGSLGLEALSRGMDHVTFVERDRHIRGLLEQNIQTLGVRDQAAVLGSDVLSGAWMAMLPHRPLSLIFLDPPYRMASDPQTMAQLVDLVVRMRSIVDDEAVLVLRTDDHTVAPQPDGWDGPDTHAYGSMALHFYFPRLTEATHEPPQA